jgi:hypothetical protein
VELFGGQVKNLGCVLKEQVLESCGKREDINCRLHRADILKHLCNIKGLVAHNLEKEFFTKIMSGKISRKRLFGKHKPGFVDDNRTSLNELD